MFDLPATTLAGETTGPEMERRIGVGRARI